MEVTSNTNYFLRHLHVIKRFLDFFDIFRLPVTLYFKSQQKPQL